ncbi:hypothetical protein GE21DRAFT_8419 [Neurospora crassa]|uniref:Uncharacterized protein n=1 Tax=Neurospora crassa (strain ATCC 24698 / 74-OR23-1A / CBS 708.71 / DSM 1257 / FGSC 987) TaxID=367110 RepID=Q7S1K2_NEUCR|nr:hypothetical protein NCU09953 [Neurospora crassa OR74A]EAA29224.1 hypothetical protein NCU09953 [Neurospora crassa OR74A]KHE79595.1 hypothetical protein GE21DRAFT_8419 [Neurospora crassa]|eukprot:XP_958460.1 hypothetical protein NCU09953 [Neurospora crassa OR74A]
MTKYTAEYMLAQVKDKAWLNFIDPDLETLKLYPIPELKTNLSNCSEWERAVRFHLQYYGLHDLVECMKIEYPDGPQCEDFKTPAHWRHWQHHCLHAYSIIQSQAVKIRSMSDFAQDVQIRALSSHKFGSAVSGHLRRKMSLTATTNMGEKLDSVD